MYKEEDIEMYKEARNKLEKFIKNPNNIEFIKDYNNRVIEAKTDELFLFIYKKHFLLNNTQLKELIEVFHGDKLLCIKRLIIRCKHRFDMDCPHERGCIKRWERRVACIEQEKKQMI